MATTIHRIRGGDRASRGGDRTRHEKLEQLLDRQDTILRKRRQVLRDSLPSPTWGVMDFEERALEAEEQGVGFSLLELTSRTVQGIETALRRLDAGQFGTCPDCRCPIGNARLRALPFAALCVACQARHDVASVSRWVATQRTAGTSSSS